MAKNAEVGSIDDGCDCENKTIERLPLISKNLNGATCYPTPKTRLAFAQLRQTFIKAPILWHFDLECHIWIKINVSDYAIDGALSQLALDNLGW